MKKLLLITTATLSLSCGDAAPPPLDCAWIESEKNCWASTLEAARTCLPPTSGAARLSADSKTCSYTDGTAISFAQTLVIPPPDGYTWNFELKKGGTSCLTFEETEAGQSNTTIKMTTAAGTLTYQVSGLTVTMTCPDATKFQGNGFALLDCKSDGGGGSLSRLPGTSWSASGGILSFGLFGAKNGGSTQIFTCAK